VLYLLAVLLLAVSAMMVILSRYLYLQRQALQTAMEQINDLTGTGEADTSEPEMVLTVRVLNPIEVAKRESRSARIVADHMPVTVRKLVYRQVMKEVGMELAARGIDSDINVEFR